MSAKPSIPVVIDGPNFINRVMDLKVDPDVVAAQLSLTELRRALDARVSVLGLTTAVCDGPIEFVCSQKLFGRPKVNQFTSSQRTAMLTRFMREVGAHVDVINLPGDKEKGVDGAVQAHLDAFSRANEYVVLIAADRDYVPALQRLRSQGHRVLVGSLQKDFPPEIENEAWAVLNLEGELDSLFVYSYPTFSAATLTFEQVKSLIANSDDRKNNQIRVSPQGRVHILPESTAGYPSRGPVKFELESFIAGNQYVGPRAASASEHVSEYFSTITNAWKQGLTGYIDYPVFEKPSA